MAPRLPVPPVPMPSSGPPPLSLRSLEKSLLAWWSNPASECPPVLLCHQIIRYFSTSRGHCGLPYARSSSLLRRQQPCSVAAWQRWHKPEVVPSCPGWEGAGWSCRLEWPCHQLLSVGGTCPSSPALSIIPQTHKTLLASGAGQCEAGTQKCFVGVGGHFPALSTHLPRGPLDFAFSQSTAGISFLTWSPILIPPLFPPPMTAGRQGAVSLNTSPGRSSLLL